MWNQYRKLGEALVASLAEAGEAATCASPGEWHYPNCIRFPGGIGVRYYAWMSHGRCGFAVELLDRYVGWLDDATHVCLATAKILEHVRAVRVRRAQREAHEGALRRAAEITASCGLADTRLRAVAVDGRVCVALEPVEANEKQVRALRRAVAEIGLKGFKEPS